MWKDFANGNIRQWKSQAVPTSAAMQGSSAIAMQAHGATLGEWEDHPALGPWERHRSTKEYCAIKTGVHKVNRELLLVKS